MESTFEIALAIDVEQNSGVVALDEPDRVAMSLHHGACALVTIERDVLIAPGCHLPSGARTHGTSETNKSIRDQPGDTTRVVIGEGTWVGSAAVVMADVGAHSVIAAGAVVHDAIPAGVVAGGVPARVLKRR